jgi:hypothetical protein
VRYNLEQRIFNYDCDVKTKSHSNLAGEIFALNFRTQHVLLEIQFPNQRQSSEPHGFLIDRKPLKINRVSTEEKLGGIGRRLEN